MAELKDTKIPQDVQEKGSTVIGITDEFCLLHLDARVRPAVPQRGGQARTQASLPAAARGPADLGQRVIYAMASQNFLLDLSQPMHLSVAAIGRVA